MSNELHTVEASSDLSFRPTKRRKFYRKRVDTDDSGDYSSLAPKETSPSVELLTIEELIAQNGHSPTAEDQTQEEHGCLSVAEILRQRKTAQRRRGRGIDFSNTNNATIPSATALPVSDALAVQEDPIEQLKTVVDRFAPQTGQVADVDKHMMAYIDSELAKRRQAVPSSSTSHNQGIGELSENGALIDAGLHRQPASLGKLHEIDLGPDATLKNIARTEEAKRRLEGGTLDKEGDGVVKLRRDGKPFRRRRRRNSDDVKRDKLVEEIMKESRLEIYDEPEADLPNDDQAADDRIAEQFRRDFMDAISSRRKRTSQAAKANAKGAKVDDRPRGPKLGGSRSARAAMRELQEKAAKK